MTEASPVDVRSLERPEPTLMTYYALASLLAGPGFPILLLIRFFRYRTLRYRFEDEGVAMSWGVLFRREVYLAYARIQDIHLQSNAVERRLGLARIEVQTASGSAGAEMTIEGLSQYEAVRDFLYGKMRGAQGLGAPTKSAAAAESPVPADELAATLREVTAELRAIREHLENRP